MATAIGMEKDPIDLLNNLVELDYDAMEAYTVAIERLKNPIYRQKLNEFRNDQERHTQNVGSLMVQMNKTPPLKGNIKAILTKGKVYLGQLMGDKGILTAMRSNEDDTNTAYERAVERTDLPEFAKAVLRENLADERRHRAWIEDALREMNQEESAIDNEDKN